MLVLVITDILDLDMVVTSTESVRLRLLQKLPLRLKLTQLFFTVPMDMAVLVLMVMLVLVITAMLVLDITDMLVLDITDMLVLVITDIQALDMVVTTTESVRLKPLQKLPQRLKLIQLFFTVPMAMAVLVMLVLVIMAMLVLDITDMLVSDIMDMLVLVITDMLVSDILDTVPTMASVQLK